MFEAKVILDSISRGHRLTTIQATFPRFILAEVNTHRVFSRNSASSRAIPVPRRIAQIEDDPFIPLTFGRNQAGMQAGDDLSAADLATARAAWMGAISDAIQHAQTLVEAGVHKQWANRVIETYAWHTAVISATEWENHDALRAHPAASPEYRMIAELMRDARAASTPVEVEEGQWHLPYVLDPVSHSPADDDMAAAQKLLGEPLSFRTSGAFIELLRKVSVGRCAAVSYERQEEKNFAKDVERYTKLRSSGHMSPFEHVARPMTETEYDELFSQKALTWNAVNEDWEESGELLHFCGNFNGWVQERKLIPNEHNFARVAKP